ncbi:TPA: DUF2554 family protein, partial [Escherichia coli]|nr:DUF2554 family protein [Escherichia coli]HBA9523040.1 DUF2554 family protein [Escherichia coli]HBA9550997.1 DUF2554 family protein [Escherichia coli]HBA9560460.1 DUF2554 family protein [Escherichia coli]
MLKKFLTSLLIFFTLFSGHLMASNGGHKFLWVESSGHQLRHEADSEEIRFVTRDNAESLREYLFWQKSYNSES